MAIMATSVLFRIPAANARTRCPVSWLAPHGAIEVIAPVNARVVNVDKCVGCGICVQACPWAMTSLNGPVNAKGTKSNKCTLCNGNPECVQACPAGALKYMAWSDRTKDIPARQVVPASIQCRGYSEYVQQMSLTQRE